MGASDTSECFVFFCHDAIPNGTKYSNHHVSPLRHDAGFGEMIHRKTPGTVAWAMLKRTLHSKKSPTCGRGSKDAKVSRPSNHIVPMTPEMTRVYASPLRPI